MRFTTPRSSRIQRVTRTYTGKQQSRISWLKLLVVILLIWLCVIAYWMFVIGLGETTDAGYDMSMSDSEVKARFREEMNKLGLGDQVDTLNILKPLDKKAVNDEILQKSLNLEHIRLWKPQPLRKLEFQQPSYITEMIKSEYKRAEWHPKDEKTQYSINYEILPKDYLDRIGYTKQKEQEQKEKEKQKEKEDNNSNDNDSNDRFIKPSGNYKCLYYCDVVYDYDCVLKHLQYWRKSQESAKTLTQIQSELESLPLSKELNTNVENYPRNSRGFLTFKNDCGGFNNLRQAFEYFVVSAWLYKRTLVFPVTEGWYLIDWGPIKRAVPKDTRGVSNYHNFYDVNDLSKVVSLMNMTEFLEINSVKESLNLESKYVIDRDNNKICEKWNWDTRQDFKKYLNQKSVDVGFDIPFGPNHNVLMWPNESYAMNSNINNAKFVYGDDVQDSGGHNKLRKDKYKSQYYKSLKIDDYIGHRRKREYTSNIGKLEYIHYPSCHNNDHTNHRYLCQIATSVAFGDYDNELKFKRLIRDHVHLVPQAFEIASYVISYLGLFEYSAAHIRRNDFQFKNSWIDPSKSFSNIDDYMLSNKNKKENTDTITKNKYLRELNEKESKYGEILYIATDAEPEFFDSVKESFEHMFYRYDDFFNSTHGRLYNDFVNRFGEKGKKAIENVPRKLVGLIEMVICAGGRRFFGTTSSTYSAYITRLRGYIDAPDKGIYFHNHKGESKWNYRPTEYMREFADMWEDIKDFC